MRSTRWAPRAVPPLIWFLGLAAAFPTPAAAQGGFGPSPVGVTEARRLEVGTSLRFPGSVTARRAGLVASEIAGLVEVLAVREGDRVRRGAELVRLRAENLSLRLDAATAARQESAARLEQAERRRTRAQELFAGGVISQQDLDDAISEVEAWSGRVAAGDAEIARLSDDLERSVIRAPYAGAIVAEHVQVGEWLAIGAPVVEMVDLSNLEVVAEVPEQHAVAIRGGQGARIELEALPGRAFTGTVAAVVPRADDRTRTFPVRIRLDAAEGPAPGMLARVALGETGSDPRVFVPKDAIVRTTGTPQVFVVEPAGDGFTARATDVEVGQAAGEWVSVRGIESGVRVVTRGNERLPPEAPVIPEDVEYPLP